MQIFTRIHFFPSRRSSDLEKTDQALVLQELQQLKNLIHSQHKTELNLSPDFLLVYNYLVEQEVEENLAYELIETDRKSTRLNSSHVAISYAVFCLKKKRIRGSRNK